MQNKKNSIISKIINNKDIKNRLLFTVLVLFLYRVVSHITVPGIDKTALANLMESGGGGLLGALSMFTGGSLDNFAIVMMGLTPYINASIIVQLLTVAIPKLGDIAKDGPQGQRKISKYTKILTFPLSLLQGYGMILLLNSQFSLFSDVYSYKVILPALFTISAGTFILIWMGDLITEKGLGNGISLIIFSSIVTAVPSQIFRNIYYSESGALSPSFLILFFSSLALIVVITMVSEAYMNIPVTYTSSGQNVKSVLPIRLNQAGMIPIIFALSIMYFPSVLASFFVNAKSEWLKNIANLFITPFNPNDPKYIMIYFVLILAFSFFYVSIVFKPDELAENIQKRGGFIAGYRPGSETSRYLSYVSNHITFFGGLFIAFVATFPLFLQNIFDEFQLGTASMLVSGAGLIIVVSTVMDVARSINSKIQTQNYDDLSIIK